MKIALPVVKIHTFTISASFSAHHIAFCISKDTHKGLIVLCFLAIVVFDECESICKP